MDDKLAIHEAKTTFRDGYNNGEVDLVMSAFADGFASMCVDFPSYWGAEARAEFRHRTEHLLNEHTVELIVIPIAITLQGTMAFDYGWHEWKLTSKRDGQTTVRRERYFQVWSRGAAGAWKIQAYFTNADVPETSVFSATAA